MKVIKIYPQGFASNSYFLTNDDKTAIVIDPSQPRVFDEAKKNGFTVKYVLLTHGHFDHMGGVADCQKAGAKVGCSKVESEYIFSDTNLRLTESAGRYTPPFDVDFTFRDGEELNLCGIKLRVIETPGHTAGSVCFLVEDRLIAGDTLFFESVGRVDLPTGSGVELERSVKKLYALSGDYTVYSGHGDDTTLEHERKYNGYIRA